MFLQQFVQSLVYMQEHWLAKLFIPLLNIWKGANFPRYFVPNISVGNDGNFIQRQIKPFLYCKLPIKIIN